jgi:hypothetical protein
MELLTRSKFDQMKEAEFSKEVLQPLLKAMGYKDVFEYHGGSGEKGKDIVCWEVDELGLRRNMALVVKAVRLSGKVAVASEVAAQIQQAFNDPYLDPVTGKAEQVHECWVVTNKDITKETQSSIRSIVGPLYNRFVKFVDGNRVWSLVEEFLQPSLQVALMKVAERVRNIDPYYYPKISLDDEKIAIELKEKFPGASKVQPIEFSISIPEGETGKQADEAMRRLMASGVPATIPGSFLSYKATPEFLRALGLDLSDLETVTITTVPLQQRLPLSIIVDGENEDRVAIEFVELELVQGGNEEATLEGQDRMGLFRVKFVLNLSKMSATLDISIDYKELNAVQTWKALRFQRLLARSAKVTVIHAETEIELFRPKLTKNVWDEPNEAYMELIEKLAIIQRRLQRPIIIPQRSIKRREAEVILDIYEVVTQGVISRTWTSLKIQIVPNEPEQLLAQLTQSAVASYRIEQEALRELFGEEISLGPATHTFPSARIKNLRQVTTQLKQAGAEEKAVTLHLVAADSDQVLIQYKKWMSEDDG